MYKKTQFDKINNQEGRCIIRLHDGAIIPPDLTNADYQAYLKWFEEGNIPLPADEVTA
jgi:hypothetical protein